MKKRWLDELKVVRAAFWDSRNWFGRLIYSPGWIWLLVFSFGFFMGNLFTQIEKFTRRRP